MNRTLQTTLRITLAVIAVAAGLLTNEQSIIHLDGAVVTGAEARIGRPLTPMSYAGVARRTTRRAVAVGAVAVGAAVVAAPVVVAPACVQTVDPYGMVYTRCR
jgi:hypothetical protein